MTGARWQSLRAERSLEGSERETGRGTMATSERVGCSLGRRDRRMSRRSRPWCAARVGLGEARRESMAGSSGAATLVRRARRSWMRRATKPGQGPEPRRTAARVVAWIGRKTRGDNGMGAGAAIKPRCTGKRRRGARHANLAVESGWGLCGAVCGAGARRVREQGIRAGLLAPWRGIPCGFGERRRTGGSGPA